MTAHDALRRFRAAYAMELRLLCRHWAYPLLHLVWAGFLFFVFRDRDLGTARAALESEMGRMSVGLLSLVALFMGAAGASRSSRAKFGLVEQAFPTGAEVPLGRWLAGLTAVTGLLFSTLALAAWCGPRASFLEALPIYLAEALITFTCITAFAWWLVSRLGMRRWLYPVLVAGWLGAAISLELINTPGAAPGTALLDLLRLRSSTYTEVWGRLAEGDLPLWFNLFYAGIGLFFVALIFGREQAQRQHRRPILPGLIVAGALALSAISATQYISTATEWGALAAEQESMPPSNLAEPGLEPESADSTQVVANLSDPAQPRFTARVLLRNQSSQPLDRLHLTLNHQFDVESVNLPYEREGDVLTLTPPQPLAPDQTLEVQVEYAGPLNIYQNYGTKPVRRLFIHPQGVQLTPAAGWYPMAGQQWLNLMNTALAVGGDSLARYGLAQTAPAAFALEVQAPAGWGVISNLPPAGENRYAAASATWASLFASPRLTVERIGQVAIAGAHNDMGYLLSFAPEYETALAQLQQFFPDVHPTGITIAVLDEAAGLPYATPPADGLVFDAVSRFGLSTTRRYTGNAYYYVGQPLLADLWLMEGVHLDPLTMMEMGSFLWNYSEFEGDADRLVASFTGINSPGALALSEVYQEQGKAGVMRVLTRLKKSKGIGYDQMEAWIREAARNAQ